MPPVTRQICSIDPGAGIEDETICLLLTNADKTCDYMCI